MADILYTIIILPIEYLMDAVAYKLYSVYKFIPMVLIGLSIVVSTVTLPLYIMADKVQQEERNKQKKMDKWIKHIRSTFKGDERAMILFRYYNMEGYHPINTLKGLMPLFIQIPFFIVAYHYIKGLSLLNGVSFMGIADLAFPDGLFMIGDKKINVLPIVMTLINWISTAIYSKGFGVREKIQSYGLSVIFLVLLYNSPSGLVFYWTCNNLFSLGKNIYSRFIQNKKLFCVLLLSIPVLHYAFYEIAVMDEAKLISSNGYFVCLLLLPLIIYTLSGIPLIRKSIVRFIDSMDNNVSNKGIAIGMLIALTFFGGFVIPVAVTAASPEEFARSVGREDVLLYVKHCFLVYFGTFILWGGIILALISKRGTGIYTVILMGGLIVSIIDYIVFGKGYGTITADLKYELKVEDEYSIKLLSVVIVLASFYGAYLLLKKNNRLAKGIVGVLVTGSCLVPLYQLWSIKDDLQAISTDDAANGLQKLNQIKIDRGEKNVIFIMMDKAIASYVPFIMNEKPELLDSFDGFTYFPDTLSFGWKTIFASPAVFGSYEYMPEAINRRTDVTLVQKHNEALLLMPVIFGEHGYDVTVIDLPYAGYSVVGDLSIFEDYPYIHPENLEAFFADDPLIKAGVKEKRLRNTVFYSAFRTAPRLFSEGLYDKGNYMMLSTSVRDLEIYFLNEYRILENLPDMTQVTDDGQGGVLVLNNCTAHDPCFLQLPDYEPAGIVDNSAYDMEKRYDAEGNILRLGSTTYVQSYCANMAAFLKMADYFDFLKEEGVYDNTRIIIAADHGHFLMQNEDMIGMDGALDIMKFNPLLMFKDYDAKGFTVSDEFMTNADAPLLAIEGLIDDPVNPFTGNRLSSDAKNGELHVTASPDMNGISLDHSRTVYNTSNAPWYAVHDSALNVNNWSIWKERGEAGE